MAHGHRFTHTFSTPGGLAGSKSAGSNGANSDVNIVRQVRGRAKRLPKGAIMIGSGHQSPSSVLGVGGSQESEVRKALWFALTRVVNECCP
jgi:hypothetical protein